MGWNCRVVLVVLLFAVFGAACSSEGRGDDLADSATTTAEVPETTVVDEIEDPPTTEAPETIVTFLVPEVEAGGLQDDSDSAVFSEPSGGGSGDDTPTTTNDPPSTTSLVPELTPELLAYLESLPVDDPREILDELPPRTEAPPTTVKITETTVPVTVPSTNERVTVPIREGVTIHDDGRATVADPNLDGDNNPATGDDRCHQGAGGVGCVTYYYADDPVLPARANEFVLIPNPGNPFLVNPGTDGFESYQPVDLQVGSWRQTQGPPGYDFDSFQIVVRFDPLPSLGADIYQVRLCVVTPYFGNSGYYVGTANGVVVGVYAIQDPDGRYRLAQGDGWGFGREPC